MEILGYFAAMLIGVILGLLGGGGSILAIPILVYFFEVEPVMASAYSLFIVGVTSLFGAIPKYQDHLVDMRAALYFGLPSIASIFATRHWLVPAIPDVLFTLDSITITNRLLILGVFSFLMIAASLSMVRRQRKLLDERPASLVLLAVEGALIGFLTGFVGAGGGFLIIPALVWLTRLPFKTAVGTSLFIIAINSLVGFLGDVLNHPIAWPFLLSLTALATLGIFIGHRWQRHIAGERLRRAFGWFVLATGVAIMARELFVALHLNPHGVS